MRVFTIPQHPAIPELNRIDRRQLFFKTIQIVADGSVISGHTCKDFPGIGKSLFLGE